MASTVANTATSSDNQAYSTGRLAEKPASSQEHLENRSADDSGSEKPKYSKRHPDGRIELTEEDAWHVTGYAFPQWRKWQILGVVFIIQISMNLNASMYANGVERIAEKFHVSKQAARTGQMSFLIAYAFGCELWAPWSEEYGRWPIQQLSLFLVNVWQIPCAFAPNLGTLIVCRALGGLSTAGGSVTLGVLADMFPVAVQDYAVAFLVLSSVGGSVVGAVVGAFVQEYLSLRWVFWIQLIFGGAVQIVHFFANPETRSTILLDREAKKRRKAGETNVYGPSAFSKLTLKKIWTTVYRPWYMFFTEPIVLWLSLLSGFSDALLFTFLESFPLVYGQWGFGTVQVGLAFIPILIGYVLSYLSNLPLIAHFMKKRKRDPDSVAPESRLYWLLWLAPLETIGLFGFAWTGQGPNTAPWIAPMIFSTLIAIANYQVYSSSIDYQTAAYGPYAASATGGNDLARDFLAGVAALYSTPLYTNIPGRPLEYASTVLACLSVVVILPIYVVYWKGPQIRAKSKFAQSLDAERKQRRQSMAPGRTPRVAKGDPPGLADNDEGKGEKSHLEDV